MKPENKLIIRRVFSNYRPRDINAIILFGSRARGDFSETSDWDVNVFLNKNFKRIREINNRDNIWVNVIGPEEFSHLSNRKHSFLYCTFRDGIPLYCKNKWFNKTKSKILKMKPSKELAAHYIQSSLENLFWLRKHKYASCLDYEDRKVAANKLGFGILMDHGIYPVSPHTLKDELIKLNKKYKRFADNAGYFQEAYYKNKKCQQGTCKKRMSSIIAFSKNYLMKNFPRHYTELRKIHKL